MKTVILGFLLLMFPIGCKTTPDPADPFPLIPYGNTSTNQPSALGTGLIVPHLPSIMKVSGLSTPRDWTRPRWINNSGYFTPVQNQGATPECAAYAMEYILKAAYWRHTGRRPAGDLHNPIYQEARRLVQGSQPGTTLEGVIQASTNLDLGLGHFTLEAIPVWSPSDVQYAIHQYGGVLAAMQITQDWERYRKGLIGESGKLYGTHAQVLVGYDDGSKTVFGVNSWGVWWGRDGFWEMSEDEFFIQYIYGYAILITWETQ